LSASIRYIARGETPMPIFEYKCQDCGTRFEKIVSSFSASVLCGKCQSPNVDKMLSVFAVAKSSRSAASVDDGPCRTCGARERGMCGE
jgi:putative FmdB family regulatory protein